MDLLSEGGSVTLGRGGLRRDGGGRGVGEESEVSTLCMNERYASDLSFFKPAVKSPSGISFSNTPLKEVKEGNTALTAE